MLRQYIFVFLFIACYGVYGQAVPSQIKVRTDSQPVPALTPGASPLLSTLSVGSAPQIFPSCTGGNYYVGFQLYYDLGNNNTQVDWTASLTVQILNGAIPVGAPLTLSLVNNVIADNQTYIATAFHNALIVCNSSYVVRVESKTISGTPPQGNIALKILLYKEFENTFNPAAPVSLNCNYVSGATTVGWTHSATSVLSYDLEWVFIGTHEKFTGNTAVEAFGFKEPVRITTAALSYNHLTYYPTGKLWYRVRMIGYDPTYPTHRLIGNWKYSADAGIAITNLQLTKTWQEQTVFAEDGKYKKVMSYYDGTLRQRQVLTNLSTENVTLVGESYYDYEGRKSIDILPVPATDATLTYKPGFNVFQSLEGTVTANTSATKNKFHYDNRNLNNSIISTASGAGKYYSSANTSTSIHKGYIPNAEGYVYSQSEYLNDGTGRVSKQAGVGKEFKTDGNHAARNFYGTAAPAELKRLFGSNIGNASHYKKNLVLDPNGQLSVSYLDQEDRVVATALAGGKPDNVDPLPSFTALDGSQIIVNLNSKNEKSAGISSTSHKLLNVAANTPYSFKYDLSTLGSQLEDIGCVACVYDLKISITNPDGDLINLAAIAGNESGGTPFYERKNFTAASCSTPSVMNNVTIPLTLIDIGDYTITKVLTPRELTFESISEILTQTETVQELIEEITVSYEVDSTDCEICTTCPVDDVIDEAIDELAELDCETITQKIILSIKDLPEHINDPTYEPTQTEIQQHAMYCEYQLCTQNMPSDVFEKQLARAADWTTAVSLGYNNLINLDPFFNNTALSGNGYKPTMQSKLNSIFIAHVSGVDLIGTILQVTDPANLAYYVDSDGNHDVNGFHILYADLMNAGYGVNSPEVNEQHWILYKSFYLDAKRKTKLGIPAYTSCASALEMLQTQDNLPLNPEDVVQFGEDNGGLGGPVTDEEVATSVFSIETTCGIQLNPTDSTTVANNLKTYFDNHPEYVFKFIMINDLTTDPNLIAVKNLLLTKGCGLDSVAVVNPFDCLHDTTILYSKYAEPSEPVGGGCPTCRQASESQGELDAFTKAEIQKIEKKLRDELEKDLNEKRSQLNTEPVGVNGRTGQGVNVNSIMALPTQAEYDALWAIYNSTGGANWINRTGWSTANPNVLQDVTGWFGITTMNGHIVSLKLGSNGLVGTIPPQIGNLAYLEDLRFGTSSGDINSFSQGTIPPEIGNLKNLKILHLTGLELQGSIPYQLGRAHAIWDLVIADNEISGAIPDSLYRLTNLINLQIVDNNITGSISPLVGNLVNLKNLILVNNSISGTIPVQIAQLTQLQNLWLQGNQLTGSIPPVLGNLSEMLQLLLGFNQLSGSIPSELGNLTKLTALTLNINNLSGTIPTSLGNLTKLDQLLLSDNELTGTIPTSLGNLNLVQNLFLHYNKLTGVVPTELGNCSKLRNILVSGNRLSGPIPSSILTPVNMTSIIIDNNKFTFSDFLPVKQAFTGSTFAYAPQDSVDVKKVIGASLGDPVTLTTDIDRTTSPGSLYQWFKDGVALGAASTTAHTLTIPSVSESNLGFYWYRISNPDAPALTLTSRKQQLIISDTLVGFTYCLEYDSTNVTLNKFQFVVNWDDVVEQCLANAAKEDSILINYAIEKLMEEQVTEFYSKQSTNCLGSITENFWYEFVPKEYHYTLYYYDQAGNLVQTVPPQGVTPLNTTQVSQVLSGAILFPAHTMLTRYKSNSLNQTVWQKSPDSGMSQFWYNDKGQLRLSQNAQQLIDGSYSYTKYDKQGRVIEVGEMPTTDPFPVLVSQLEDSTFPSSPTYLLQDVTKTFYDAINVPIQGTFAQGNVRGRVSWVEVWEKNAASANATYYNYDIHGNVKALLQQVPGLPNKRTDYVYSLVSGKVNFMMYQYGQPDQFIHKYTYDSDNRIKEVYTSIDGFLWDKEATYQYYQHGPLARVILGEYTGAQGLDYYYTLQGWIKGMNMPYSADPSNDGNNPSKVGRDVMSYALGYYKDDFKPGDATKIISDSRDNLWTRYNEMYPIAGSTNTGYFNGNIAWMETDLKKVGQVKGARVKGMQAMQYRYDQLHRIMQNRSLTSYTVASGFASRTASPKAYDENFSYDANGNLLTLNRLDGNIASPALLDNYNYQYYNGTNKLRYLNPITRDTTYTGNIVTNDKVYNNIYVQAATANVANGTDATIKAVSNIYWVVNQPTDNFDLNDDATLHAYVLGDDEGAFNYNAIGNLVLDQDKGVKIEWTPYGKIRKVTKNDGSSLSFKYDGTGNRIEKKLLKADNSGNITRYVRDTNGNLMAIYSSVITAGVEGTIAVSEQAIYGGARLGMYKGGRTEAVRKLGMKNFELSNHLGNVLTVITDNIRLQADSAWATVINASDYYAFGSDMPNRGYSGSSYRYGFNGKEDDTENTWAGAHYDYGFRIYNPRYGRFLSVDPLTKSYPSWSPYPFAMNRPIDGIDLDGLEWRESTSEESQNFNSNGNTVQQGESGFVHQIGNKYYTFTGQNVYQDSETGRMTTEFCMCMEFNYKRITFDNKAFQLADNSVSVLGVDGSVQSFTPNGSGMIELPYTGVETTGAGTLGNFEIDGTTIFQYYNRNDVVGAVEDQWGEPSVVTGLLNSVFEYRASYPNDIIQIGDMRSPTNGKVSASTVKKHHGDPGAIDIRYLGVGGSYQGQYNNANFSLERNRLFIDLMGRNGFTRVLVAPTVQNQITSNNINIIGDNSGVHDDHFHFDRN